MPAEPPVDTPRTLADAYALLAAAARAAGDGASEPSPADPPQLTPLAGGTDVMVRITGEIGEPPVRLLDLWRDGHGPDPGLVLEAARHASCGLALAD